MERKQEEVCLDYISQDIYTNRAFNIIKRIKSRNIMNDDTLEEMNNLFNIFGEQERELLEAKQKIVILLQEKESLKIQIKQMLPKQNEKIKHDEDEKQDDEEQEDDEKAKQMLLRQIDAINDCINSCCTELAITAPPEFEFDGMNEYIVALSNINQKKNQHNDKARKLGELFYISLLEYICKIFETKHAKYRILHSLLCGQCDNYHPNAPKVDVFLQSSIQKSDVLRTKLKEFFIEEVDFSDYKYVDMIKKQTWIRLSKKYAKEYSISENVSDRTDKILPNINSNSIEYNVNEGDESMMMLENESKRLEVLLEKDQAQILQSFKNIQNPISRKDY